MKRLPLMMLLTVSAGHVAGADPDPRAWYVPFDSSSTGPCLCLGFKSNPGVPLEQLDLATANNPGTPTCPLAVARNEQELSEERIDHCMLRFARVGDAEPSTQLRLLLNVGVALNQSKPVLIRTVRGADSVTRIYVEPRP